MVWGGSGTDLLDAAEQAGAWRHVLVLLGAGVVTGAGQIILRRLSSGNGIDTTAAIWFHAGRMPAWRTLGSAVLSVIIVGMGVSLGREGAPKQAGAVIANFFSDRVRLSDEQRRLLVACGAGAGMGAAYGVPLGGALFALEVMRGMLALRYVLPALVRFGRCGCGLMDRVARCAHLLHPRVFQLRLDHGVGAPRRAHRGSGFGRIRARGHVGRSHQAARLAAADGAGSGIGIAGSGLDLVPAIAWKRQGRVTACIHEPSSAVFASDSAGTEARGDRSVRPQRRARRVVHAVADSGRVARRVCWDMSGPGSGRACLRDCSPCSARRRFSRPPRKAPSRR